MGTEGDPLFTALLSESACPKVNMPLYVCCKTRPLPCTTRPVHYPSAAPSSAAGHPCCCLRLHTATAVHSGWDMCSCGQPGLYHQCSGRGVHGTAAPHVSLVLYIMSRWGVLVSGHMGCRWQGCMSPAPVDIGGMGWGCVHGLWSPNPVGCRPAVADADPGHTKGWSLLTAIELLLRHAALPSAP